MTITRETLELAALAAGKRVVMAPISRDTFDALDIDTLTAWRPHLDDGDAARLAVRLMMMTDVTGLFVEAYGSERYTNQRVRHDGTEPDKLRAWREAVVKCAAAVGERVQKGGA